jgi:hypothetical protein
MMKNHTCTATIDWSQPSFATDTRTYLAAAQKIDSSAALCFVDLNFTFPKKNSSLPFDVVIRVNTYNCYALVSSCSALDREMFLRELEAGFEKGTGYPGVAVGFTAPACAL